MIGRGAPAAVPAYAELHCISNFTFLRGASHPQELVERASALGYAALGRGLGWPLVASGDVHMHVRERRRLQDALTAIRLNVPVAEAGWHLYPNGERHLREQVRLARLYPASLLAETVAIAQSCTFS